MWGSPTRLTDGRRTLADADLCGQRVLLAVDPWARSAWHYEYPVSRRCWLADDTLLYRREIWDANRFGDHAGD